MSAVLTTVPIQVETDVDPWLTPRGTTIMGADEESNDDVDFDEDDFDDDFDDEFEEEDDFEDDLPEDLSEDDLKRV